MNTKCRCTFLTVHTRTIFTKKLSCSEAPDGSMMTMRARPHGFYCSRAITRCSMSRFRAIQRKCDRHFQPQLSVLIPRPVQPRPAVFETGPFSNPRSTSGHLCERTCHFPDPGTALHAGRPHTECQPVAQTALKSSIARQWQSLGSFLSLSPGPH